MLVFTLDFSLSYWNVIHWSMGNHLQLTDRSDTYWPWSSMPSFRSSHMLYVPFPSMHRALMSLPSHETTPYHRTFRTQTIRRDRLVLLPLLLAIANTQHGCCCNCLSTGEPLDNDVQSTRDASESIAITRLKPAAPVALTSFPPFLPSQSTSLQVKRDPC